MSLHKFTQLEGVTFVDPVVETENKADSAGGGSLANYTKTSFLKTIYPVGTVLMFYGTTNPSTYFPGTTWTALSSGYYIKGTSTTSKIGTTGGYDDTASHTLTTSEMPSHTHARTSDSLSLNSVTRSHSITTGSGSVSSVTGSFTGTSASGWVKFPGSYESDIDEPSGAFSKSSDSRINGWVSREDGNTGVKWTYTPSGSVSLSGSSHSHTYSTDSSGSHSHTVYGPDTGYAGGGGGHSHTFTPLYINLYFWRRTA